MNKPNALTATIRIAATPADVFPYLVESSLLVQWIGSWAELKPEPGGVFAVDMEGTSVRGEYLAVEPPDRVLFTWGIPGNDLLPAGSSTVEIALEADGDETVLQLTHSDLPAEQYQPHQAGWASCLEKLGKTASVARDN